MSKSPRPRPTSRYAGNPRARHALGRAVEEHVARFLSDQGCRVLHRRYGRQGRYDRQGGEIDIIVDDGGVVAFVEVKGRRSRRFGTPFAAVTRRKRLRLVATARAFLAERRWRARRCRFDVVGVELRDGQAKITWARDAFRPRL